MAQHSPEPWKIDISGNVVDARGRFVLPCCYPDVPPMDGEEITEPNLERIVACVNACRHLPSEYLQWLAKESRCLVGSSIRSTANVMAAYEAVAKQYCVDYERVIKKMIEEPND